VETADDVHADLWEMHPLADEAVCCLTGTLGLHLRATQPDTPDDVIHLLPGRAVIVPRGRWHRIDFEESAVLLAATVRRGTELEKVISRIGIQDQVGTTKRP
jgi:quercetin dioxygenase-like cupin family protein